MVFIKVVAGIAITPGIRVAITFLIGIIQAIKPFFIFEVSSVLIFVRPGVEKTYTDSAKNTCRGVVIPYQVLYVLESSIPGIISETGFRVVNTTTTLSNRDEG